MIIPYMKKRIESAFNLYCDDFCRNVTKSINIHQDNPDSRSLFKDAYSLFVLLESLKDSDYYFDPTKEILLQEALESGCRDIAAETARQLSVRDLSDSDKLIKTGISKQRFTPYLKELYSDALMLLNSFYSNNYRSCYISLRCMLEDLYRHLYYKDHVQEYWAITRKQNDYSEYGLGLKPEFFRDYIKRISHFESLKNLPRFKLNQQSLKDSKIEDSVLAKLKEMEDKGYATEKEFIVALENTIGQDNTAKYKSEILKQAGFDPFQMNETLYKVTSAYIHGSRPDHLSGFESNSSLLFNKDLAQKVVKDSKDVITLSAIFLISAHREYFLRFNDYTKSLVFELFDNDVKYDFRKCLNV